MTDATTCIRSSRARGPLADFALVLTAVSIDHHIDFDGHEWGLWVATEDVAAANEELNRYQHENRPRPVPSHQAELVDTGWFGVLGYLLVIWALPTLEASTLFGWDWRELGVMNAGLVKDGEWWRTVTALTLHGDLPHLAANSLFGGAFGLFVGRYLGSGLGWLLVLMAGALGNFTNAWLQADPFRSVGASTATFAALALVGAFVWRKGYMRGDWRRRFAPVFGGIALLAYTGFGGENTDVMAHVTGFAWGLVLGVAVAILDVRRFGRAGNLICALLAFGLIAGAWAAAGTSGP